MKHNPEPRDLLEEVDERIQALEEAARRKLHHRMTTVPARTTEEKAARVKARAVRKRQKLARRRNRKR